jgi:hypothetical protein
MSEMWRRACEILELRGLIAGVPMKKDATSMADLAELVGSMPADARIHLLGIGPESPRYAPAIAVIRRLRPDAQITSDSVTIRRLVGRKNGPKGGPREITRLQDEARAIGITDAAEVKAHALTIQGWREADRELAEANAAGWFDDELYDSAEEAAAHAAELRADRERELANVAPAKAQLELPVEAPTRKEETMSKIAIATILLAAACGTTPPSAQASATGDTRWVCNTYFGCADMPTVTTTHQLCAAPSSADVQLPGDAAAADLAQLLAAECNAREGTPPTDDGRDHVCELDGTQEPWSCDVECTPEFEACQP